MPTRANSTYADSSAKLGVTATTEDVWTSLAINSSSKRQINFAPEHRVRVHVEQQNSCVYTDNAKEQSGCANGERKVSLHTKLPKVYSSTVLCITPAARSFHTSTSGKRALKTEYKPLNNPPPAYPHYHMILRSSGGTNEPTNIKETVFLSYKFVEREPRFTNTRERTLLFLVIIVPVEANCRADRRVDI